MSLSHLPTRRIVSVLTRAMRRAMAPPAHSERALTSSGVNPTWGPMIVVTARSAAVISALRTVDHLTLLKTAARCVSGVAPCCHKCATRRWMAATVHARGFPVELCPIDYPLKPFFFVIKRRLTKVVVSQVVAEAVVDWVGWYPTKNWISRRLKGVETVSVPPAQYSLGRRRKKKVIQARSAIFLSLLVPLLATEYMQWRMETGRGRTLPGAGYYFSYVASCRPRLKSIAPMLLSLGSGAPTAVNICPTERMYCSTLRLWIGLWLAARMPVRTL